MTAINATMIDHREEDKIWIDETDPTAHQETVYLNAVQGLAASILTGGATPLEECLREDEVEW
ncbi:MAG: hypothetical protein HFG22_18620 [Lachnospiraceae bacterium]|nr:hypothetical protein [Lachnospiraceae bacterium]